MGDDRFADVSFADLQTDPVRTLQSQLRVPGLDLYRRHLAFGHSNGRRDTDPGSRGAHDYDLADYGLTPEGVRERFADYLAAYDATA